MKYLPPALAVEGTGVKRGLTAVEAAILLEALGAEAVEYPLKVRCCGGSLIGTRQEVALRLCRNLLLCALCGAETGSGMGLLGGCTLLEEYSTGGETYRTWQRAYDLPVTAGTVLGTTGGRVGQWALDVGAYDERVSASPVANAARWSATCSSGFAKP